MRWNCRIMGVKLSVMVLPFFYYFAPSSDGEFFRAGFRVEVEGGKKVLERGVGEGFEGTQKREKLLAAVGEGVAREVGEEHGLRRRERVTVVADKVDERGVNFRPRIKTRGRNFLREADVVETLNPHREERTFRMIFRGNEAFSNLGLKEEREGRGRKRVEREVNENARPNRVRQICNDSGNAGKQFIQILPEHITFDERESVGELRQQRITQKAGEAVVFFNSGDICAGLQEGLRKDAKTGTDFENTLADCGATGGDDGVEGVAVYKKILPQSTAGMEAVFAAPIPDFFGGG